MKGGWSEVGSAFLIIICNYAIIVGGPSGQWSAVKGKWS